MNKLLLAGGAAAVAVWYWKGMKQASAAAQSKQIDSNLPQTITTANDANAAQYSLHNSAMESYGTLTRRDLTLMGHLPPSLGSSVYPVEKL